MSKRGLEAVDTDEDPINWRQDGADVTLYDETNRDAWIQVTFEAGVPPERRLFMICDDCGAVFAQRTKPGRSTVCGDCGATFDHRRD
ncbi:hypothetical protein Htur_0617 [Haloterrigena turkmenica DSM 5511]|uniref:Small CPxCG-related zinc finger protein n=1 Tax=Haloterrigena turkmenica (strain ATCC 51198 / DSM 5511 / JCM 9101 / NCIMB 13204 / VKM B-1734 / 4k) TaxID=543526 RepID=D2RWC6_HALTV|nr:hypothetical protein [Haloterrigena turkmenica]ADB59515.1 hypothetical protein Htur_0617 [Haloterrigena turkmenica DSM 5511]